MARTKRSKLGAPDLVPPTKEIADVNAAAVVSKIIADQEALHGKKKLPKRVKKTTPKVSDAPAVFEVNKDMPLSTTQATEREKMMQELADAKTQNELLKKQLAPTSTCRKRDHHEMSNSDDSDTGGSDSDGSSSEGYSDSSVDESDSDMGKNLNDLFKIPLKKNSELTQKADDTPATGESAEDIKMLTIMKAHFKKLEDCGPAVTPALAEVLQGGLTTFATKEEIEKLNKKYKRPENCPLMVVPQPNKFCWTDVLKHKSTREREFGLQKTHELIVQSMIPVVELMNTTLKSGELNREVCVNKLAETLKIQAFASLSMTHRRRVNMRAGMDPAYVRELMARENPPSTFLFGEDSNLQKKVKEMKDCVGVGRKTSSDSKNYSGYKKNKKYKSKKYSKGQQQSNSGSSSNTKKSSKKPKYWQKKK